MAKTEIYGYETTPYEIAEVEGGWAVRQAWWDKVISRVFPTRELAEMELIKTAKATGHYRALRRKVR